MTGGILIGYLIVGSACLIVGGICGFVIGRKKGDAIIEDLTRRKDEADTLLVEVKDAAEKGRDELERVGTKVKDRIERIIGSG